MSAVNGKPYLEIRESRFMSFVIASVALLLALCAPIACVHLWGRQFGPLLGIIVAVGGVYYSCVHWRRLFSGNRVTLRVDEAGLSGTMVGAGVVVPWSAVQSCTKAYGDGGYTILLRNGRTVKISQFEMPVFASGLEDYVNSRLTRRDDDRAGA